MAEFELLFVKMVFVCFLVSHFSMSLSQGSSSASKIDNVAAILNASYKQQMGNSQEWRRIKTFYGKYGRGAGYKAAQGYLFYKHHDYWCNSKDSLVIPSFLKPWIALIERGNCSFVDKILHAKSLNASAAVIFNNQSQPKEHVMLTYGIGDFPAVSISRVDGQRLVAIQENSKVYLKIDVGKVTYTNKKNSNWQAGKTSVLFVLVSFILLMCISLAWLVFYYVQRFRYFYARDRKEKELMNAAKKAMSKLKTKTCDGTEQQEDQEETCAVCLEGYKCGETLRILSCRHEFHKTCVDPWLLEHRTCPICKTNILKALGMNVPGMDDTGIDMEEASQDVRQVVYAREEFEGTSNPVQMISTDFKSCSNDITDACNAEVSQSARSITVSTTASLSTDDDESLSNSTSGLVLPSYV